jgi:DNA-binding NarL/FixJ family response regulator
MQYRIAIVDDRYQNIVSISEKLEAVGDVQVMFTARNGVDFLEQMKRLQSDQLPHVVLMDIDMPVLDGIETVRQGAILYADVHYIMLTVFDDDDKLFEAIRAGADGYLLKEERIEVVLASISDVMEHAGAPMSPRIARKALQLLRGEPERAPALKNIPAESTLSDREMEVLHELINGLDYRQIAAALFVSPNTVRKHIANIYEKLHVTSRAQAVKLALRNNWI